MGLGGRLDSTNVVNPVCACIGPIELEHTEFLGDTVEKIAAEKGGIIKPASKVVIAKQVPSVRKVFEEIAKERNAEVFFVDDEIKNLEFKIEKISLSVAESAREAEGNARNKNHPVMSVSFESKYFSRPVHAKLKMLGKFQAQNAALAALAVKIALPEISEETIEKGLSNAVLPARFEVVPSPKNYENIPYLVLDGAHTVNSETFTMETMRETGLLGMDSKDTDCADKADFSTDSKTENDSKNAAFDSGKAQNNTERAYKADLGTEQADSDLGESDSNKPVLLFACAADKDVKDIAPLFKEKFRKIFLTKPGNVKISDTKKMEDAFDENGIPYDFDADFSSQIKKALNFADEKKSVLLVTGSFYLVAEAKKILLES